MALRIKKQKAIELRLRGMSYSQIKELIKVSKSTLSIWLNPYPLPQERIRELRDFSPRRIESFRNTMAKKREKRLSSVYEVVSKDISRMTKREIFLAGLFLYWGEGGKTARSMISLSNTDPSMMVFYLRWLDLLGIPREKLRVKVQMYADMDEEKTLRYWAHTLKLPRSNLRSYIKKSKQADLTYKTGFGHGTCMISYGNQEIADRVMMSLKYIQKYFL